MDTPLIDFPAQRINFPAIFAEATLGDVNALDFLRIFLHWVHLIDDVIDGQSPGSGEYVILVNLELLRMLAFNPFWEKHKHSLFPIILQAARAYADSNAWAARPDFRDRASSDVLKSQYQDVWFHVAYLCGGYAHMCRVSEKYRIYDYDSSGLAPVKL